MSYLFILLSFLFVAQPSDPQPKGLSITTTGKVELPADKVRFNININATEKTPQTAFNVHKKREKALVQLLDKYKVNEKNIRYEPISIRKRIRNYGAGKRDTSYVTHQKVTLTLSDFDIFQKIQIGLIEHNFDDFDAVFTSSKIEEGKDEALKLAIKTSREKANLMAKEAGIKVGAIQQIYYGSNFSPAPQEGISVRIRGTTSLTGLRKFNQSVTVEASVSIRYAILSSKS